MLRVARHCRTGDVLVREPGLAAWADAFTATRRNRVDRRPCLCFEALGALLLLVVCGVFTTRPLLAQDISLSFGNFDALRGASTARQGSVTYRPGTTVLGFRGEAGIMLAGAGAAYAHFAVLREIPLLGPLTLRPSLGAGVYRRGGRKDLGFPLEFRSGLELSVALRGGRVGIELYHLSNAHLSSHNPGEESVVVCYTVRLDALRSRR